MGLGHGLAGSGAVVHAEVECIGGGDEVRRQVWLGPVDPDNQAGLFGAGQFLEPGDRSASADQGMAWRGGEFVQDDSEEVIGGDQTGGFDLTERRKCERAGGGCDAAGDCSLLAADPRTCHEATRAIADGMTNVSGPANRTNAWFPGTYSGPKEARRKEFRFLRLKDPK